MCSSCESCLFHSMQKKTFKYNDNEQTYRRHEWSYEFLLFQYN